jgi:hypothetical protein
MPQAVTCQCGARFAAKDELAGKTVRCPKCKQPIAIPRAEMPPPAPASGVGSILDEIGFKSTEGGTKCPHCEGVIPPGAAKCKCGYNLQTGTLALKPAEASHASPTYDWKALERQMKEEGRYKAQSGTAGSDDEITPLDIFLVLFCGEIACIYMIILAVQGNPKGIKLFLLGIVIRFVLIIFMAIAMGLMQMQK